MSSACGQCGGALAKAARRCNRCGAQVVVASAEPSYGMLDLEPLGQKAAVGSLALDIDPPAARRKVGRADSGTVRGAATASVGKARPSGAGAGGAQSGGRSSTAGRVRPGEPESGIRVGDKSMARPLAQSQATRASAAGGAKARASNAHRPEVASVAHAHGLVLGDDPLAEGYGQDAVASLEIEEAADPRRRAVRQESSSTPAPREPSPQELRAQAIERLAGYGRPPAKWFEAAPYWVRVTLRKRELDVQLLGLSAQRKRQDDDARAAIAKLGEALHARRKDPRLATLARQFQAVATAETAIGDVEKTGQQKRAGFERERKALEDRIRGVEEKAAPLQRRESELVERTEAIKESIKRAQAEHRRLEQELAALRKKQGVDVASLARVSEAREAALGQAQTLGIELQPLEDDLAAVRRELAVHLRELSARQQEQQTTATAVERAQHTQRVSSGSAQGARRDALTALAQFAMDSGLAAVAPSELAAVQEATARRDHKRGEEELLRAATLSFDERAYKLGMSILIGSTSALLLTLVGVVLF